MRNLKWIARGTLAGALVFMPMLPAHGEEEAFEPGLGLGLLVSPGFHSYMGGLHPDGKAASAWLNMNLSGQIRIDDRWALLPALDLYGNGNSDAYDNSSGQSSRNLLWVPSVNVRYAFGAPSAFFLQAGPNYTFARGGGSLATFKGGPGGAAALGYAFSLGIELNLGYTYLPIAATSQADGAKTTANFGGPYLQLGFRF